MYQDIKMRLIHAGDWTRQKTTLSVSVFAFILSFLPGLMAFGQQPNKIQRQIDEIKAIYNNEINDYITDGQRTVWVKSYKKWMPQDTAVMKKEDPDILKFLGQAIQHNRLDVLEQLLPDYYREHGGVKSFSNDIMREQAVTVNLHE